MAGLDKFQAPSRVAICSTGGLVECIPMSRMESRSSVERTSGFFSLENADDNGANELFVITLLMQ